MQRKRVTCPCIKQVDVKLAYLPRNPDVVSWHANKERGVRIADALFE